MEKVKYFIPGIKVKCINSYCRNGEIATVVRKLDDYQAVEIKYESDGSVDTARIGMGDAYDLEFVNIEDVETQRQMEEKEQESAPIKIGQIIEIKHQRERSTNSYCNVRPDKEGLTFHNGWASHNNEKYEVEDVCYSKQLDKWFYNISADIWYADDSVILREAAIPKLEELTEFPIEGQCKTITPELEAYLRKTRTPEGDQSLKERAKSVCWNTKGYWYVSRSSGKFEYPISYLQRFFTQQPTEQPMAQQAQQQFDYTPQGGFQLTLPPEIVGAALSQATETHFRESEKKFEKHREDVAALVEKKKQMIETELYQKFEKTISCDFVEFRQKVVEDYLTSKQIVIELGQEKKYEFSLEDKHAELPKMVTFLQLFKQAMIVGPSGSGKSTMAKQAAEVMGLRYGAFSCNLEASKSELVGFANIDGYVESSFLDFYENGGVFLIDEYDSMSPSIAVVLNAAFDRTGMIAVPNRKGKTTAKKHKDFYCILAGNTWGSGSVEYQGREMQDAAFLDRFKMCRIFIDYDENLEKSIAGKHYSFFKKVRNYVKKKVDGENFSTRSIYDASVLLENGFTQQDVLTMISEHWDEALRKDLITAVA
jgi:energy-coupling factor transporter ATP-binding protein EcfA2